MFAEAIDQVNPELGWKLICFCIAGLSGAASVVQIAQSKRTQRREISFETEFATRESVEEVRGEVQVVDRKVEKLKSEIISNGESRRIAIESKVEAARCEARDRADELNGKLDQVNQSVHELKGETKMITQSLARLEMRPAYVDRGGVGK